MSTTNGRVSTLRMGLSSQSAGFILRSYSPKRAEAGSCGTNLLVMNANNPERCPVDTLRLGNQRPNQASCSTRDGCAELRLAKRGRSLILLGSLRPRWLRERARS
jgi:hypothetical protein